LRVREDARDLVALADVLPADFAFRRTRSGKRLDPVSRFHSSNVWFEILPSTSNCANLRRCAWLLNGMAPLRPVCGPFEIHDYHDSQRTATWPFGYRQSTGITHPEESFQFPPVTVPWGSSGREAKRRHLRVTGTLGVLRSGAEQGLQNSFRTAALEDPGAAR
jgi:hypothetical protein